MLHKNRTLVFSFLFILFFSGCTKYVLRLKHEPEKQPETTQQGSFDITQLYSQITTHPEIDLHPAISPDGQWLAFSSKRSGNMDIWIKSVKGGTAVQITTHKTDDIMPSWSPNGKQLVFVSYRDDALGDLWMVSLEKGADGFAPIGTPKKLTKHLGADITPVFSPNGKFIAFTSDRSGKPNIYLLRLKKRKVFQLTKHGAINPTWSPQGNRLAFVAFDTQSTVPKGQIFYVELKFNSPAPRVISRIPVTAGQTNDAFPFWNPNKEEIFFTRYDQDTNQDGLITPDDQPSLWKVLLITGNTLPVNQKVTADDSQRLFENSIYSDQRDIQLSFREMVLIPRLYYDFYPVCSSDSTVYFISQRSGNDDIWSVDAEGPIARRKSAFFQFQFADTYFPLPQTDLIYKAYYSTISREQLHYRLLAFNRVMDFFPTENIWVGWALYEIARTYAALDQKSLAQIYYSDILSQFVNFPELLGKTELRLFELDFEIDRHDLARQIERLNRIVENYHDFPEIHTAALLLMGEVYYLNSKYSDALRILEKLIADHRDQREKCAFAQLLIGDTYSIFGQTEEVINSYLKVVRQYPGEEKWVDLALNKIIALERKNDFYETISGYRNLIARYGDYRRLAARAQVKLGELFFNQQDYDAAIEELSLVSQNYPEQREEIARAELLLAEVFLKKNDDLRAINHYKKVIERFGDVRGGLFVVKAKERLLNTYLTMGNRLRAAGEINAARIRYQGAVNIAPRHIDAHRGLIATMYMLGKIDAAIKHYSKLLKKNPDDEINLYMLGLCYSYKATEKSDRTKNIRDFDLRLMKKSNELIENALSKNYRIVQAYLTLSYNYEFIEKYESALSAKKPSLVSSLVNTVIAPIKSIVYWLTFQKEKKPEQWYEKAIDALTTAIALNDEKQNPVLESELALNLASNYYNLREFGFERAYYYYHVKLQYDSTFVNKRAEAQVFKRMGHCALVVEDFKKGPVYLQRAIKLYRDLGDEDNWLLNIKRLALLHQMAGNYDESIEYFLKAAEVDKKKRRYAQLEVDYRSIAYNYQLLNDEEEAIRYAQKALALIKSGKVPPVKAKPNWIKIGILGVEFPVWNLGQIGAGASTAAGGFTTEEEKALIYSILGKSTLSQRSIDEAIAYMQKKLAIYRKRKDKLAQAIFLNNIGYLYYLDFEFKKAWDHYARSLKICKAEDNVPGILINSLNLGSIGILVDKLFLLPESYSTETWRQNLNLDPDNFHQLSLQYLQNSLSLLEKEPDLYIREKIQLYNLLGNLHFLEHYSMADSLKNDPEKFVKHQLAQLETWVIADSCYQTALQISKAHRYKTDEMFNQLNIGYLSLALGDVGEALDRFSEARKIALQNNLSSRLWQIDFAMGQALMLCGDNPNLKRAYKEVEYYLNEAVTTLEESANQLSTYRLTPFYYYQVRSLYQTAIDYSVSKGNVLTALRLTEQYRGKKYLDLIGSHKLELKKERHKIFLGNARFLKNEISRLEKKIKLVKDRDKKIDPNLAMWVRQKKNYEKEYQELLEDLKSEDPELESFIHTEPVTYSQIQKILEDNAIAVNYFVSNREVYVWTISPDTVSFHKVTIDQAQLGEQVEYFISQLKIGAEVDEAANNLWHLLIKPVAHRIDSSGTVVIISDDLICNVPFNYLINFLPQPTSTLKQVVIVPAMANYFYSYQKRKIKGTKLLLISTKLKPDIYDLGYDGKNLTSRDELLTLTKERLQTLLTSSDLIYLDADVNFNDVDPLMSSVKPDLGATKLALKIKDIYAIDFQSSVFVFDGIETAMPTSVLALEKALLYAGNPSLIMATHKTASTVFWDYFFDALLDYPVAEAVSRAQSRMFKDGYTPNEFAFYQVVGYEGMNDDQELQFARERFVSRVAIGNKYYEEHNWAEAVKNYEQALIMAKKNHDAQAVENLYDLILECSANGNFWEKAISYQLEIIEAAKANNDVPTIAKGYNYLVYFYTQSKNFKKALYYQNEYLKLAQQYNLKDEIASSYHHLGLVYEREGNNQKAVDYYTAAIKAYREIGDSLSVADCLKDRGRIYLLKFDQYSKAIEDQQRSLEIFQKVNNVEKSLEVLQNLGLSHERLANYRTALKYQQQAFELAKKLGNAQWIALAQQYLANVNWKMGNYEQALKHQKQALKIFEQLKNLKFQAVGLATQGLILMSLGDVEQGLELEQRALDLAQRIDDRLDMATIHKNISIMYRSQQRWNEALEHVEQAIQLDKSVKSRRGLAYDYHDLGVIKFQQGKIDEAFQYFRRALAISQEIYDGRNEVMCLYEIGKANYTINNTEAALDTLMIAVNKAEQLFIPEVKWRALRTLGMAYRAQGKFEESLAIYQKALATIENMRSQIKVEEYKSGFIDDKLDVYNDVVDLYLKLDQPAKALEIVERSKSRNFIDLLANKDINFSGTYDKEKFSRGKALREEISRVQNSISGLVIKGDQITVPEKETLARLNEELKELKRRYENFLIQLKEENPELAEMVSVEPPAMDLLQQIIPDSVVMVEYFYTDDFLYIWTVTNKRVRVKRVPITEEKLFWYVDTLRNAIEKQLSVVKVSQAVYDLLIDPIEGELSDNSHIIFIPHSILHYLPFATLMDGDERYLIEKYSLSLSPSATVLKFCMEKGDKFVHGKDWEPTIMALGNPDLGDPRYELPFAEKEIESIELLYRNVYAYLNKEATETRIKETTLNPNMVLFSCHGEFDAGNPLFSALLLTPDEHNDGRLEAHEIFGLNLNAYLIAMSACETGLAKIGAGDEVIGISRSFIYAGGSSLLSSLWKVDDLATAVMIKRFFRYLKEGHSRAKALQLALVFVKNHINVHPKYWSAFNITGDFR